jgi:hypothetical protein
MTRLGLHLMLHSGRAAIVRLVITAAAVAVGVALLLSTFALYHGYQTTIDRPCWSCTGGTGAPIADTGPGGEAPPLSTEPAPGAALWNFTQDFFRGRLIERADIAALGANAPTVPGLTRTPAAGEYMASPALADLISTVPAIELGDRFPGRLAGTIGPEGLSGPDALAIVVGHDSADLANNPNTTRITAIQTAPRRLGDITIYRFGFALGAVALLVPMLVLIGTATRLAAARREERFAAMRLVGATPRQIGVIAGVEAGSGALLGAVLGIIASVLLQPLVARIPITGARFFPQYVDATALGYGAVLIGIPVAATAAALLALRRVQISPLGVRQRITPPPPRAWRVAPLLIGLVLFVTPLSVGNPQEPSIGLAVLGLALTMIGLVIGGSWLTMQASRLLGRMRPGAASVLAARRMADEPRATFRAVSGVVLAVFVGTLLASAVPAALAAETAPDVAALQHVLRLPLLGPSRLGGAAAAHLLDDLRNAGASASLPIYEAEPPSGAAGASGPPTGILACDQLTRYRALGTCPPGVTAVEFDIMPLLTGNAAYLSEHLPLVSASSHPYSGSLTGLPVRIVLATVDTPTLLERVRTTLAVDLPSLTSGSGFAVQTFGEVAQVRADVYTEIANVVLLIVGLTLIVAGCSLTIATGGGVLDRKRPFTLLRVSGSPLGVLRRVVLLESMLPLLSAAVIAALAGLVCSIPVNRILTAGRTPTALHWPESDYYFTVGVGLLAALAVVTAALPLLNRVTRPDTVRFE